MSKIYYCSYSRNDADSTCPRKRYLGSEWGGTGLSPIQGGWDLLYGDIIHKYLNLQAFGAGFDYSEVRNETLEEALKYFPEATAKDYAALAEGHIRGFVKYLWPLLMAEYSVVETEQLRHWEVEPQHVFRFKQDLLLKHKTTGMLLYVDYKTTSSDSPQWLGSWLKSPQLHSSIYALEKGYNIKVDRAQVIGFYKGWKDKKTNRPTSIFAKGWVNREYPMSPQYSYEYMRNKGWEPFSVFDEFDDLSGWVADMPQGVIEKQFPCTAPISPRPDVGEKYFKQLMFREREVASALQRLEAAESDLAITNILDEHFPQDFNKCDPAYGFKCEFKDLCWIPWIEADPLGSGQFVRRAQQFEDGITPDGEQ